MLVPLIKNSYQICINLYNENIYFTVDTGATHTTLNVKTLAQVLNTTVFKVRRVLRDGGKQHIGYTIANDTVEYLTPCVLRNVTVGDIFLPKFNVQVGTVNNLLGMDFLQCCELHSNPGEGLQISNFVEDLYRTPDNAFELLSLSEHDKYNAWFLRLDSNQKFNLKKEFSVVHYCCTLGDFENVKEQLDYIMTLPKYQVK